MNTVGFLNALLLEPKGGTEAFLRNVGELKAVNTTLQY
jgi:hypothetical protein